MCLQSLPTLMKMETLFSPFHSSISVVTNHLSSLISSGMKSTEGESHKYLMHVKCALLEREFTWFGAASLGVGAAE